MKRPYFTFAHRPAFLRRDWCILLLLSCLFGYRFSIAQTTGEKVGPQFPLIISGARLAGIADASTAITDYYSGFGSNPATLSLMKNSVIDYTTQRVQKGVTFEHLGISYLVTPIDAIAFGIDMLHYGGTDFYTKSSVRDLGFEMRTGLAYSRLVADQLSLGINLQAIVSTTGLNSVWAFAGDIGLAYAPGKYLRYGVQLKGISSNYNITTQILPTDVFTNRIPRTLSVGVTIDFPFSDLTKKVVVTVQNDKILGESDLIYKIGVEYYPYWSPVFRAGVRGGFIYRDPDLQPRFGLSFGYTKFSLDYAYGYVRRYIQPSHMVTLTYVWR